MTGATAAVLTCLVLSVGIAAPIGGDQGAPQPPLPMEVVFSAPVEGETDVRLDVIVRIQFSRDVDPASFKDRVRVAYSLADSVERGEAQPPAVSFTITYVGRDRALEIKPAQRLEHFRQVKVDLLEGIVGPDGAVLGPWTLNFATGGS